jgi:hypothetical protein
MECLNDFAGPRRLSVEFVLSVATRDVLRLGMCSRALIVLRDEEMGAPCCED